jgi:cytochrome b
MAAASATNGRVRVWDLPTRLSHWTTVILFGVCWWTAETDDMRWHRLAGYGVLGAVLFRLAWGFWGGQTARFGDFVRGPAATWRYVRKLFGRRGDATPPPLGHNPLGAVSIIVMLALLLAQAALGLFAVNVDGFDSGPFSRWVSFDTGRRFAHWHAADFDLLLLMIGVHLTAIAFYRLVRKESLVPAMIHGFKRGAPSAAAPYFVPWWRAALLAAGIFVLVALVLRIR